RVAEGAVLAGHDVSPAGESVRALCKSFHVDRTVLIRSVHVHHHGTLVVEPEIAVGIVIGQEVHEPPIVDGRSRTAPTKQRTREVKDFILELGSTITCESIALVAGPSPWEILSNVCVARGLESTHQNLGSVIHLRN